MSGSTVLLTSWEERQERGEGVTWTVISSGEPHTRAIFDAVVDRYNAVCERARPTVEEIEARIGEKVTLIQHGENMIGGGILAAEEGKLFRGTGGSIGILPKGKRTKGLRVRPEKVLDLLPGWEAEEAAKLVGQARDHFPTLAPLTQERLDALPPRSDTLSLCVFGSYRMPDSTATDALYLVSNYMREDDIIEGVLLIRPEHGYSESGSILGQQLVRGNFGEVVGYEPISFAEALKLTDLDFDEAYEQALGRVTGVIA